jgi:hypothetical protein
MKGQGGNNAAQEVTMEEFQRQQRERRK